MDTVGQATTTRLVPDRPLVLVVLSMEPVGRRMHTVELETALAELATQPLLG
jgi:hypothetical protein